MIFKIFLVCLLPLEDKVFQKHSWLSYFVNKIFQNTLNLGYEHETIIFAENMDLFLGFMTSWEQ